MNVADAMSRGLISIGADAPVEEALRLMLDHHISGLPVLDAGGALAGMLTEGDFLRRAELGTDRRHPRWLEFLLGPGLIAGEYTRAHGRKVGEIMSQPAVTIDAQAPLATAVELMERHRFKRLPVTADGRVVGLLSRADLLRAYLAAVSAAAPADVSDAALRRRILDQIDREHWAPRASVDVTVQDGLVRLRGVIGDERSRVALRVMAENTAGVKRVRDELTTVDFHTGLVVQAAPAAD
jgi:CBS domain-containing protein